MARFVLFTSEAITQVNEDGVISFKVADTYCAEVFRYDETAQAGEQSVSALENVGSIGSVLETVGSIRTLDSRALSAVGHAPMATPLTPAPVPVPAPMVDNATAHAPATGDENDQVDLFEESEW